MARTGVDEQFWETNADAWTLAMRSRAPESRRVTNPAILDEIARRRPSSVLDLGCGEGWLAGELLARGIRYLGLDSSAGLVERAREAHPNGRFEAVGYGEISGGAWRAAEKYDLAVFNFSLFDEDLSPLLQAVRSALNASGSALVQTLHPCFALKPYEDGWRSEDFKSFPVPFEGSMPWYGRTLASWVRAISECGWRVEDLREPADPVTQTPFSLILALKPAS